MQMDVAGVLQRGGADAEAAKVLRYVPPTTKGAHLATQYDRLNVTRRMTHVLDTQLAVLARCVWWRVGPQRAASLLSAARWGVGSCAGWGQLHRLARLLLQRVILPLFFHLAHPSLSLPPPPLPEYATMSTRSSRALAASDHPCGAEFKQVV